MDTTQQWHLPLPTIAIEAFRAFRDRARFELRPLTLLYGRNQAGKSTLLRLLPFLGDSLVPGAGVLDIRSPALRGATFKELGWLGREPVLTPRLELEWTRNDATTISCALQWADLGRGPGLNAVRIGVNNVTILDANLSGELPAEAGRWAGSFIGKVGPNEWSGRIDCVGLLPTGLPGEAGKVVEELTSAIAVLQRVQWLQSWRTEASSQAIRPTRMYASDASDLAGILQSERAVVLKISEWLSRPEVLGDGLELAPDASGRPLLHLRTPGAERLPLTLAGEGARALIPIVAHACLAEERRGPSMLAIEEPEAHLHPGLQVALLDRLVDTVRAGVPVVVETHSVHLLRAMQRSILQHKLEPSQVGLWWMDRTDGAARMQHIDVTSEAILRGWPPAALEEEQRLAREVASLRWEREARE